MADELVSNEFPDTDYAGREAFVLAFYHSGGKMEAAIKASGTTRSLAYLWRDQEWFKQRLKEVKIAADRVMERKMTTIIDKAFNVIENRLDEGDPRYVPAKYDRNGELIDPEKTIRVGVSAHTAVIVAGTLFDKRDKLRATDEGRGQSAETNQLQNIASKLEAVMNRQLKKEEANTIDVEVKPIGDFADKGKKPGRKKKTEAPPCDLD